MLTLLLKACRCDVLEAVLPGIGVPVCSALLSAALWLDPREPWLAPSPDVGVAPGWEASRQVPVISLGSSISPSGKLLGLPVDCRLVSNLTKFVCILHTCIAHLLLPKPQGRWESSVLVLVYPDDFEPTRKSFKILFFFFTLSKVCFDHTSSSWWAPIQNFFGQNIDSSYLLRILGNLKALYTLFWCLQRTISN